MKRGRRLQALCAGVAALALAPSVAQGHLVVTGMGPVYDGISHFALSPEDALPVAALGLYAGLQGPARSRWGLAALPLGWLAGGLAAMGAAGPPPLVLDVATVAVFVFVGGALALNRNLEPRFGAAAAATVGLVRGLADLGGASLGGAYTLTLTGMAASAFALFAIAASLTLPLERPWMVMVARVSGSWVAALGLLLAGWLLRYGALAL